MRWTETHDILLCREILLMKPYQFKPGTKESGTAWTSVSDDLNAINLSGSSFSTTQKSVRDRHKLLLDKFKKMVRQQEGSSGTNEEQTELDNLLENIKEEVEVAVQNHAKNTLVKEQSLQNDSEKAQDIRQKAMESLSESRKRKGIDSEQSHKSKRNTGSETMSYLINRSEKDFELRKQEMELKKSEVELQREQQMFLQNQMNQQLQVMNKILEKFVNK